MKPIDKIEERSLALSREGFPEGLRYRSRIVQNRSGEAFLQIEFEKVGRKKPIRISIPVTGASPFISMVQKTLFRFKSKEIKRNVSKEQPALA